MSIVPDLTPIPDGFKRCSRCKQTKTADKFCVNRRLKDGLNSICRACQAYLYRNPSRRVIEEPPAPGLKRCSKCKEWKIYSEYQKSSKAKDGLSGKCRGCKSHQDAEYYKSHRAARADAFHRYYHAHRERILAYSRRYQHDHPEVNRYACRRNQEKRCIQKREYYKQHSHEAYLHSVRRKTRKQNLPVDFTFEDEARMFAFFGHRCAACGKPRGFWLTLALDHWIPLASPDCPGTIPTNIVPLCHSLKGGVGGCNRLKHDRDPHEWLVSEFGSRKAKVIETRIQTYFDSLKEDIH